MSKVASNKIGYIASKGNYIMFGLYFAHQTLIEREKVHYAVLKAGVYMGVGLAGAKARPALGIAIAPVVGTAVGGVVGGIVGFVGSVVVSTVFDNIYDRNKHKIDNVINAVSNKISDFRNTIGSIGKNFGKVLGW